MRGGRMSRIAALAASCVLLARCGSPTASQPSADAGADALRTANADSGSNGDAGPGSYDSDAHNCGAAGHDCTACGGNTCTNGQCVPTVLASGQSQPFSIAVDDTGVYWTNLGSGTDGGSVASTHLDGSGFATLASLSPAPPWAIAVDATRVFFTTNVTMRMEKSGTALTQVASRGFQGIAVDDVRVYWTDVDKVGAANANGDGGGLTNILAAAQPKPEGICVDSTSIYWINSADGSVWTSPKDAVATSGAHVLYQPSPPLAAFTADNRILVDEAHVYWCDVGNIQRMNKDGSGRTTVYSVGNARALTADVDALYFASIDLSAPTITRLPKTGGSVTTYDTNGTRVSSMAIDTKCIYWTAEPVSGGIVGSVNRLTK